MKKLKQLMKGKKYMIFGNYKVVKYPAHYIDEQLEEHFTFIYMFYNLKTGKEIR